MQPAERLFDRAPVPVILPVNARAAAAFGALVLALLLTGLFVYRRRTYILQWAAGWLLVAASFALLSRQWISAAAGRASVGIAQLLAICAALVFVLSADSFRQTSRVRAQDLWYILPVALWFALSPIALGVKSVLVPGYLLISAMYATAATAYLLLLKRTRLSGAGVIGASFLLLGAVHGWLAYTSARNPGIWDRRALASMAPAAVLAALAGIGMLIMAFEDITWELRQTNRRLESAHRDLEQLVITDALTGCYNRRFFHEIIRREVQRRLRYGTPLTVMFVDVDRFKAVNDMLGHEAGDAALWRVADFLRKNVRDVDYLFRWGGDEFLLLLTCTEREAVAKGEELRRLFAASIANDGFPAGFGLSIGGAELSHESQDVLAIIKLADERMYREKTRARRRIRG